MRPPYPTESGLWGKPTMINNVETLANIPAIVMKGAEWFSSIGTPNSTGTKVFALAGDLVNIGLIEVPMGITLRTIVDDIGGGIPDGGTFKAAQTGGPSGGCIPAEFLDTPVDYDSLRQLGSIMGSGGLIVMDDTSRMPDVAKFFMEFSMDESCGKCTPCRAGTVQIYNLLERIAAVGDVYATCATSSSSVRPCGTRASVGSASRLRTRCCRTLQYFGEEYESLLVETGLEVSMRKRAQTVAVTFDGVEYEAFADESVMDASRRLGVEIPSLCYLEGLSVWGGCRMCVVQIAEDHRLRPACATPVAPDMEIHTKTPQMQAHRKAIIELLFAEGNHVCAVCVSNGNCELQDVAVVNEHGPRPVRLPVAAA